MKNNINSLGGNIDESHDDKIKFLECRFTDKDNIHDGRKVMIFLKALSLHYPSNLHSTNMAPLHS